MEPLAFLGWCLVLATHCLFIYCRPSISWRWNTNHPQPKKSGGKRFPWHRRRGRKNIPEQSQPQPPPLQPPPTTSPPKKVKNNNIPPTQSDSIPDCAISSPNKIKKVKKSKTSTPPPVEFNPFSNTSRKPNKHNKGKQNQRSETFNSSPALSFESPPILDKTDKTEAVPSNHFPEITLYKAELLPTQKFEVKKSISSNYSRNNTNIKQVPKYTPWAQASKADLCFNHLDPYKTEAELLAQHNRYLNPKVQKIRTYQQHLLQSGGCDLVSANFDLLIVVDATPRRIGGYCINARTHECYYYTYPSHSLPWKLQDKSPAGNSAEFEMKNLQFALLLWEDEIRASKCVEIHSDNLLDCKNSYGAQVMKFMYHIQCCLEVQIRFKVTPSSCVPEFARLIQPADDLSRKNVFEATQFLQDFYSLVDVKGAYNMYRGSDEYNNYLNKVHEGDRKWRSKRCYCGFHIDSCGLGFGPRLRPGHGSVYFH